MSHVLLLIGPLALAIYGAWITSHDRHRLNCQQRRRKSDPA